MLGYRTRGLAVLALAAAVAFSSTLAVVDTVTHQVYSSYTVNTMIVAGEAPELVVERVYAQIRERRTHGLAIHRTRTRGNRQLKVLVWTKGFLPSTPFAS